MAAGGGHPEVNLTGRKSTELFFLISLFSFHTRPPPPTPRLCNTPTLICNTQLLSCCTHKAVVWRRQSEQQTVTVTHTHAETHSNIIDHKPLLLLTFNAK